MYLIADSGSTKTEWCITDGSTSGRIIATSGINPVFLTENEISMILQKELVPELCPDKPDIDRIYFYGAGCTEDNIPVVASALCSVVNRAKTVFVGSDLLGAARALCGDSPGIACILGTGANSCLYDGRDIVEHTPPLGFILGDEGSGAYIGKMLVNKVLRHQLPEELCQSFMESTQLTYADIIRRVYREQTPNRFLASLSKFCYANRHHESIHQILVSSFDSFFRRNIQPYNGTLCQHISQANFVGSIAFYYKDELTEAARLNGLSVGKVVRKPIEELAKYHGRLCPA